MRYCSLLLVANQWAVQGVLDQKEAMNKEDFNTLTSLTLLETDVCAHCSTFMDMAPLTITSANAIGVWFYTSQGTQI